MVFCDGIESPGSSVLMADGSWLITRMTMENGCILKISQDGGKVSVKKEMGRPCNLLMDSYGDLWVTESREPSLVKITEDNSARVIARGSLAHPFLWPNALVTGPDGMIYMTDSGLKVTDLMHSGGLDSEVWRKPVEGRLFRINPVTEQVDCLDSNLQFPSGLAVGPDSRLYMAEMVTGHIYRYDFTDRLEINSRVLFTTVIDSSGPRRVVGPAGMAFDDDENLYVAMFGQGHVAMVEPSGAIRRHLVTRGSHPTNVAFGPKGSKQLYVTEYQHGQIEVLAVHGDGLGE